MISIVLPTYNGKKYISSSIDSILNQTYKDFELIIVDDCSTDNTFEIIKKYEEKDKRISIIRNEKNRKLPASLNIGFKHAHGNYYTWTSDDNVYKKNALETLFNNALQLKADIVYSNYFVINDNDDIINKSNFSNYDNIYENNVIGACFLYRKEVHETLNGYDENLFLAEDYDFWIRAKRQFNFKLIEDYLYYYRNQNDSLTSTKMKDISIATKKMLERELLLNKQNKNDKIIILKRIIKIIDYYENDKNELTKYIKLLKSISYFDYIKIKRKIQTK